MDFPDIGLVKLAPRDLTGPGIEFYARRISSSAAGVVSFSVTLPADQLSAERLYMLRWSASMIPGLTQVAENARWYLQLGNADIQLFGWPGKGYPAASAADERWDFDSGFLVIPGGKALLFVTDWNSGGNANSLDGWVWGYSFPKGNVLSF